MTDIPPDMRDLLIRIDERTSTIDKKLDAFERRVEQQEKETDTLKSALTTLQAARDAALKDWEHWRANTNQSLQNAATELGIMKTWRSDLEGQIKGASRVTRVVWTFAGAAGGVIITLGAVLLRAWLGA